MQDHLFPLGQPLQHLGKILVPLSDPQDAQPGAALGHREGRPVRPVTKSAPTGIDSTSAPRQTSIPAMTRKP